MRLSSARTATARYSRTDMSHQPESDAASGGVSRENESGSGLNPLQWMIIAVGCGLMAFIGLGVAVYLGMILMYASVHKSGMSDVGRGGVDGRSDTHSARPARDTSSR